ncbi:MAG: ATP-binding protein, partial [bacterium]|nr:ATP-binding protein [bacterium]
MKKAPIKYNPAFLSREELAASFVVREVDLELLVETVAENTHSSNQHVLIIGPRGMGKTMLALRTAGYVADDKELGALWYPIVFSEESYEIYTAAEFWLSALFHLAKQTGDKDLERAHELLKAERDEKRLYDLALARLMDFADEQKKRLLLVVENLHMILDEQISSDDSWSIRHTLLNEPRIMLLATATTRFDEIDNSGKAMFELFKLHFLEPLNITESRILWESLTGHKVEEQRIRPIQILTGGNPRLMTIISAFAKGATFRELMNHLTSLIDEYTTYFKSNIESLPSLERKIFVTLANIWEPATAARVAQEARIDVNKASSLLRRLESRGGVSVVKAGKGKKSYQVTERLYNIYHLMRLS